MNDAFSSCPSLVVDHPLVQRPADALRDAAVHLSLDDHRVDHVAAVVHHAVLQDLRSPHVSGSVSTTAACAPEANVDRIGE